MPIETPTVPNWDQAPTKKKHHLDRRAGEIAAKASAGDPDDLLTTSEVAEWLGISTQWLEIGRSRGYSPDFLRLSPRRVRYRRGDVIRWLEQRQHASTAEYETTGGRPRKAKGAANAAA